jgi:hypothetical protein
MLILMVQSHSLDKYFGPATKSSLRAGARDSGIFGSTSNTARREDERTSAERPCPGLRDEDVQLFARNRVVTDIGGVGSIQQRMDAARRLFKYKDWATSSAENVATDVIIVDRDDDVVLIDRDGTVPASEGSPSADEEEIVFVGMGNAPAASKSTEPKPNHDHNTDTNMRHFTATEKSLVQADLSSRALYSVETEGSIKLVRATLCSRRISGSTVTCDACAKVAKNASFKRQLRRVSLVPLAGSRFNASSRPSRRLKSTRR